MDDKRQASQKKRSNSNWAHVFFWRSLAIVAFALGIIGAFLPIMPTVPFLIVATWAAGKGWPKFERWLLNHAHFGPPVRRWREHGAVTRRAKWLASIMMATSAVFLQFFTSIMLLVRVSVPLVMLAVGIWLWRRPEV